MIKEALIAIGQSARAVARGFGALAIMCVLYFALLACVYLFFVTREATTWQLVGTAVYAVAAPLLFFLLQAAMANFAQGTAGVGALVRRASADFAKILLISLPLIALAVLVVYLMDKLQARFPVSESASSSAHVSSAVYPQTTPPAPMHWQDVAFSSLRLLLLGLFLPLAGVQMWLSVAGVGLLATLKNLHRIIARAFSPRAVLVFAIGLFVFGVIPYVLIFTRTTVTNTWIELILFGCRLALAFVFTLWGWVITLGALARLNTSTALTANTPASEDVPLSSAPSPAPVQT